MFPFDILEQAFQGNPVAWDAMIFGILFIVTLVTGVIIWWKMPQLAKTQFINNTVGGCKPTVAQCHEDKKVRFINPKMFSNGFAYFRGLVYIPVKEWLSARTDLKAETRNLISSVYTIDGTQSPFFINWAASAAMMNPELQAMIAHEEAIHHLEKDKEVRVNRETFIKVLQAIKEDTIQIKPLYLNFPVSDIRNLKNMLPKSLSKSEFREFENKIRQDERGSQGGFNLGTIAIILGVVSTIASVLTLLKVMGVF